MKDITDLLRRLQEAESQANKTHDSCTEHAQKVLSESDYVGYQLLMIQMTDLMATMAQKGKLPVFMEVLASLNRIMADGEAMKSKLNEKP